MFIGNVGAGKTTHISVAYHKLRRLGYSAHRTYAKTVFASTMFLQRLNLLGGAAWRLAVSIDLLLNSALLPLLIHARTVWAPLVLRKRVVLVEEDLPGSLVDYVHASLILGLSPIVRPLLRVLLKLASAGRRVHTIYLFCDKELLPKRWAGRGTPPEAKTYILTQNLVFRVWCRHLGAGVRVDTSANFRESNSRIVDFIIRTVQNSR